MKKKQKEISAALLGITIALILWFTILGRETQVGRLSYYPLFHTISLIWKNIQRDGLTGNFLGNLILFIPVGALLPITTNMNWKTLAIGSGFSILIEIVQFITKRGVFDPDDVLLNTVGCFIGYLLYSIMKKMYKKRA